MTYDQQILSILTDVGDKGISVQLLSKHLYNLNNTLFAPLEIEDIRNYVQQYLLKNSKSPHSLIESAGRRGFYRLNTQNNADARQLMLEFKSHVVLEENIESEETNHPDLSLDLFG
jgi:hypothetical protein